MIIERWAIRQISTGYFMPLTLKNHTAAEPQSDCVPRLFSSRASAQCALNRWLEGIWRLEYSRGSDFYDSYEIDWKISQPPTLRIKEDMEVVKVQISLEVL